MNSHDLQRWRRQVLLVGAFALDGFSLHRQSKLLQLIHRVLRLLLRFLGDFYGMIFVGMWKNPWDIWGFWDFWDILGFWDFCGIFGNVEKPMGSFVPEIAMSEITWVFKVMNSWGWFGVLLCYSSEMMKLYEKNVGKMPRKSNGDVIKKVTSRVTLDWDFSKEEFMIQNWD